MKQRFIRIASSVAAVLLLAVGLIWLCHADPIEAFGYFCYGLFGSLNGFAEIFVKATPANPDGIRRFYFISNRLFQYRCRGAVLHGRTDGNVCCYQASRAAMVSLHPCYICRIHIWRGVGIYSCDLKKQVGDQ